MCTSMHYTGDSSVKHRYSEKATNFLKNLLLCFDITKLFPKKVYFFFKFYGLLRISELSGGHKELFFYYICTSQ